MDTARFAQAVAYEELHIGSRVSPTQEAGMFRRAWWAAEPWLFSDALTAAAPWREDA